LHEGASGDILVDVNGRKVALRTGQQFVISKEAPGHEPVNLNAHNPLSMIAVRDLQVGFINGKQALSSEFSLSSAIASIDALTRLSASDNQQAHKLYRSLLKNAAVIQTLFPARGAGSILLSI
jgi:hypothetical protein